ncbi:MAG: hypothetical protein EA399_11880 [Desulfovibrionales bacterium]|nr:MAG: hypothetical protein EA399_11880 [Desulfovibrionales bacterium]
MHRRASEGLTMVELLIVLFIVSLGWFTLLPRLDPTRPSARETPLHQVNTLLAQAHDAALQTGVFQTIRLDPVSGALSWNETVQRMPHPPSRCLVNGAPCPHPLSEFRIYPQGHMDRLELHFPGGERWTTMDLATRLSPEHRP